jgi:hypothetical protein
VLRLLAQLVRGSAKSINPMTMIKPQKNCDVKMPACRKLKGYAFDPSLSLKIDTAFINNIVYKVRWEDNLQPGPIGEYIEVVDYDPTVKEFYKSVDLDHPYLLAQDGLDPSESNPQFHQQMVYAVVMTTIKNFESALGRQVFWSPQSIKRSQPKKGEVLKPQDHFVKKLRIYPHAFRDANAYYSPEKKALMFGYFSAIPSDDTLQMPNALVFTCLSHDIIAHETTHAILDGMFRGYTEGTNPDVLAFHEAFADIVALFQHFTFPEVLKNQIAKTKGDLSSQNLLGELAQQFGTAIGNYGALRDAIGYKDPKTKQWKYKEPDGEEYRTIMEPHKRGSILVSAVFEAFLSIYKRRIADLLRIATGGTGVLPQGELHPDLVNRLADEASKTAGHVLKMCIRALDYCPPVDITFGDYLRAIITADVDLVSDDNRDYRIAFIDSFRKRGIYPVGVKNLSIESLCYSVPKVGDLDPMFQIINEFMRGFRDKTSYITDREQLFKTTQDYIGGNDSKGIMGLHKRLFIKFQGSIDFERLTGLVMSRNWERLGVRTSKTYGPPIPSLQIHSLKLASRVGPDGNQSNQIILTLMQRTGISTIDEKGVHTFQPDDAKPKDKNAFVMYGGCTLIFDLDKETMPLKYAISKPLLDINALQQNPVKHQIDRSRALSMFNYNTHVRGHNLYDAYFSLDNHFCSNEPFAFLHNH